MDGNGGKQSTSLSYLQHVRVVMPNWDECDKGLDLHAVRLLDCEALCSYWRALKTWG